MIASQTALLVLGVVLLLFGGKKLPELAGSLGKSMREFKKAVETPSEEAKPAAPDPQAMAAPPARVCPSCKAAMEAEWTHCPRCGTAAAKDPAATPSVETRT